MLKMPDKDSQKATNLREKRPFDDEAALMQRTNLERVGKTVQAQQNRYLGKH
jgi:hypothetical protein